MATVKSFTLDVPAGLEIGNDPAIADAIAKAEKAIARAQKGLDKAVFEAQRAELNGAVIDAANLMVDALKEDNTTPKGVKIVITFDEDGRHSTALKNSRQGGGNRGGKVKVFGNEVNGSHYDNTRDACDDLGVEVRWNHPQKSLEAAGYQVEYVD